MKLDFGCGPNKRDGFTGVDILPFDGKVDIVMDVRKARWPWKKNSIEEVHASHFLEHLDGPERVDFFNKLWVAMKPGAQATIITPHWASSRAYGDPTHKWPPVSEFGWFYLDKDWRAANAPHTGYTCDFTTTWGYSINPALATKNPEYQQMALNFYKEAAQDMHATLTCRKE